MRVCPFHGDHIRLNHFLSEYDISQVISLSYDFFFNCLLILEGMGE